MGQPVEERKLKRLALQRRQLRNRLPNAIAPDAHPRFLAHVVIGNLKLKVCVNCALADVCLAPDKVDGLVARQREQPGRNGALGRVKADGVLPDGHERLLHNVLGKTLPAGHLVGKRVERARIPLVQLLHRPLVTGDDPLQQRPVLRAALCLRVVGFRHMSLRARGHRRLLGKAHAFT